MKEDEPRNLEHENSGDARCAGAKAISQFCNAP